MKYHVTIANISHLIVGPERLARRFPIGGAR